MLFEQEERGKAALLERVRKLKHERGIGFSTLAYGAAPLPSAKPGKAGERHRNVKPANSESRTGDQKLWSSSSWAGIPTAPITSLLTPTDPAPCCSQKERVLPSPAG